MSCHKISRWVLRNGVDGIPSEWRDHIASCSNCQASVAKVRMLDDLIGGLADPNPGEAYEAGFVPRLARRLENPSPEHAVAIPARHPLAWIWAPGIAMAALAFFIGREIYLNKQNPAVTERDVPVASIAPATTEPKAASATPDVTEAGTNQQRQTSPTTRNQAPAATAQRGETGGASPTLQTPPSKPDAEPSVAADQSAGSVSAAANRSTGDAGSAGTTPEGTLSPSATSAETQVWPDRRVTKMGAISSDSDKNTRKDERGLPDQGPHGLSDRGFVDGAPGGETANVYHPLERLEAPQLRAAPGFPDSQSPAEAMRRFDQIAELRQQIATLESINPAERTEEQNRELCALWYRVGTLATTRPLLDSALQQLDQCLVATGQMDSQEWQTRTSQLNEKLSALPK